MVTRNYYILLLFILATWIEGCQQHRIKVVQSSTISSDLVKKRPGKIAFDTEIHNFGKLKAGETLAFSFVFRNVGEMPIQIKEVEKSCGCLEVKYPETAINPGDQSAIEVIFSSTGEWGNIFKQAVVVTDSGERKELQLSASIENEQFNNLLNTQK